MTADHNRQRKIALVNDLTGFGRCSVSVQLPIISHLGVQCCVLPTSVLSNHTGFESYSFQDFTPHMEQHIAEWRKLGLEFRGILTGFLGSERQIDIVKSFIEEFARPSTVVVVDPVMGDYGRPYETYTPAMCERMREIAALADIITPNLTEACLLRGIPYRKMAAAEVADLARELCEEGPERVVITGIEQGDDRLLNVCCDKTRGTHLIEGVRLGGQRSGTGDVYSAIIAADAVNGIPFEESVRRASDFTGACVERSIALGIPDTDGLCFEEVLCDLGRTGPIDL